MTDMREMPAAVGDLRTPLGAGETVKRRRYGLWRDAFDRLIANRLAVVGMLMVLLLLVMAILGPFLTPMTFSSRTWIAATRRPRPPTGWARMTWGGMSSAAFYMEPVPPLSLPFPRPRSVLHSGSFWALWPDTSGAEPIPS